MKGPKYQVPEDLTLMRETKDIYLYVNFEGKVIVTNFSVECDHPQLPYFGLTPPISCYKIKAEKIF